jgi:hypothetical protein
MSETLQIAVSLHDNFIHNMPSPFAPEADVQNWLKSWFFSAGNGNKELSEWMYVEGIDSIHLDGVSIRALSEKAIELHLMVGGIYEGAAKGIAGDIQHAKWIEVEKVEKFFSARVQAVILFLFEIFEEIFGSANPWRVYRKLIFEMRLHLPVSNVDINILSGGA